MPLSIKKIILGIICMLVLAWLINALVAAAFMTVLTLQPLLALSIGRYPALLLLPTICVIALIAIVYGILYRILRSKNESMVYGMKWTFYVVILLLFGSSLWQIFFPRDILKEAMQESVKQMTPEQTDALKNILKDFKSPPAVQSSSAASSALSSTASSQAVASSLSTNTRTRFNSAYFTLSFDVPTGFTVSDSQNYIGVSKGEAKDKAIGSNNAFLSISRFDQNHTRESAVEVARRLLKNQRESVTTIDGDTFLTIEGDDYGRYEGDSAGRILQIFFAKSVLLVQERPGNEDQDFDVINRAKAIITTMKFSSTLKE